MWSVLFGQEYASSIFGQDFAGCNATFDKLLACDHPSFLCQSAHMRRSHACTTVLGRFA